MQDLDENNSGTVSRLELANAFLGVHRKLQAILETDKCYTFCLVLFGCGAMAVDSRTQALTHLGVAIAWGLVVMVMIYC